MFEFLSYESLKRGWQHASGRKIPEGYRDFLNAPPYHVILSEFVERNSYKLIPILHILLYISYALFNYQNPISQLIFLDMILFFTFYIPFLLWGFIKNLSTAPVALKKAIIIKNLLGGMFFSFLFVGLYLLVLFVNIRFSERPVAADTELFVKFLASSLMFAGFLWAMTFVIAFPFSLFAFYRQRQHTKE